jgi:50S ribosomal subunit-associated GTPase HflX
VCSSDLGDIPTLVVFNKADLLPEPEVQALCRRFDAIAVSAVKRLGLTDLIHAAEEKLNVEEPMTKGPALPGGKVAEEIAAAMDVEVGPFGVN